MPPTSLALELHGILERAAGLLREVDDGAYRSEGFAEAAADLERWSEIIVNMPVLGLERLLEKASEAADSHFVCPKCTEYCGGCGVYWPVCQARRGES